MKVYLLNPNIHGRLSAIIGNAETEDVIVRSIMGHLERYGVARVHSRDIKSVLDIVPGKDSTDEYTKLYCLRVDADDCSKLVQNDVFLECSIFSTVLPPDISFYVYKSMGVFESQTKKIFFK